MRAERISLSDKMASSKGYPAGFDYLRIILSLGIVIWHTIPVSYGPLRELELANGPLRPFMASLVPMFFALSGFLVAGSLERSRTLVGFMLLRVLRLVPALSTEILLSALILGPIFTILPISEYLQNHEFHSYFLNIVGYIHYTLPGVFADHPLKSYVNLQLWTIPYELRCYIALGALAFFGLHRRRRWFLLGVFAIQIAYAVSPFIRGIHLPPTGTANQNAVILAFLFGVLLNLYRDEVRYDRRIAVLCAVATFVLLSVTDGGYVYALPVSYLTIYLGLTNPKKLSVLKSGDYSYGIYLYGFPIQQAVAGLGSWTHYPIVNFVISVPFIFGMAALSWHGVEKRALKLRRLVPRLEDVLLSTRLSRIGFFGPKCEPGKV